MQASYTLTVDGQGDAAGAYEFRLLDLAVGAALPPGTPVGGSLAPANETDVYRFTAAAGDQFYFDLQAWSGQNSTRWRLLDPYGNVVFKVNFGGLSSADIETLTLAQAGIYTLLVEGFVGDQTLGNNYTFTVYPVTYATQPLTLGNLTAAT